MKVRERKCQICRKKFRPVSSFGKVCSVECSIKFVKKEAERKARKEKREGRARLKTARDWTKDAQAAFNAWVRHRDRNLPCISCNAEKAQKYGGSYDCGHFKTVGGHPELRFHPDNAHKQCKTCNGGSGNYTRKEKSVADRYREELIRRIGLERVEWLEGPHEPAKYTIEDLKLIRDDYRKRLREARGS